MQEKTIEKRNAHFLWTDITNPSYPEVSSIAQRYGLDEFLVKDSIQAGHLPKIEELPKYTFFILRAYTAEEEENVSSVEDLSSKIAFFFNEKQVITIHRAEFDFLQQLRLNMDEYTDAHDMVIRLIRSILKTYEEPALWHSNQIDQVEKTIFLQDYAKISLEDVYYQKSETRISKKVLQMSQQVVQQLDFPATKQTALQDVKDHLFSLILLYEEALENANNLTHTYLSVAAQKSNDVMKLLTIISMFFLPLTFLVGVYGMNFDFMPELHWKYGYLFAWIGMLAISAGIYIWFKRKKIL